MFTLVCVRHGEAQHNLATPTSIAAPRWTEEGNLDTPLTDRGREQAAQVSGDTYDVTQAECLHWPGGTEAGGGEVLPGAEL